jgi:acetoin utilization deacetylase AcuC-like enzyme
MTTALITHPAALAHANPPGHPECEDRIRVILNRLSAPEFAPLLREEAPQASDEQLLRAHPAAYLAAIRAAAPGEGFRRLDPDTGMSPGTLEAALRAAGGNARAVDLVMSGRVGNAFVAMRPPGHHAERATAMGFCLFGNAVVAARHAMAVHGLSRVAIVDFDVHHGNGTQDLVWDDSGILFASTHQMPLYPGTGDPSETGAHGNVVNVALPPGADGAAFRRAIERHVLPAVDAHRPEMIVISAGFDAHRADPLASLALAEADFAWVTDAICRLAASHAGGRVVSTLEGGYDLPALAASVAAHVAVLMRHGGSRTGGQGNGA